MKRLLWQYEKVMFLDADMIATGGLDDVFTSVSAPAGILSTIKTPYGTMYRLLCIGAFM